MCRIVRIGSLVVIFVAAAALFAGCSTAPKDEGKRDALHEDAQGELKKLIAEDPSLDKFLDNAYGYAVFPSVGKGGLIAGGSYGRGEVYESGQMVGYTDISQATVGLQAGGQTFSEILVFENKAAMDRFKSGKMSLSANASAVALKKGAAESARYQEGVAVFVKPQGGLMFEVSIGGQKFTYMPK